MVQDVLKDTDQKMRHAVDILKHEFATIRTGRASLAIFEGVRVDYYGTPTPLNQVAKLSVPDAAMITIQPYDPALIADIEKAILQSDLGLNPLNDGKLIRVPIPPLTAERRKMLVKKVHTLGEETKNAVRHIRRNANDAIKNLEKKKEISQDEEHHAYDEIQKRTEARCKEVDQVVLHKDKELMEV
ncbi:MAG: ribosome recycling factor [Acidobacteriota bacterium]